MNNHDPHKTSTMSANQKCRYINVTVVTFSAQLYLFLSKYNLSLTGATFPAK